MVAGKQVKAVRGLRAVLAVTLLGATLPAAAAERERLAVLPLAGKRVTPEETQILDDLVVNAVAKLERYQVISSADVNALLGLERMKEAVGCNDVACAAELGGALGVRLLATGTVARLGGEIIVSLQLIDIHEAKVDRRSQVSIKDEEVAYRGAIESAVAQLFGLAVSAVSTPASPPARGGPRTVDLSGPVYEQFIAAKLDNAAYLDFVTAGVSYPTWRNRYNDKTESWVLEISKWVFSGTVVLILVPVALTGKEPDQSWGSAIGTAVGVSTPMILSSAALWVLDLWNIGDAPAALPELLEPR